MYFNLIHKVQPGAEIIKALKFQLAEAKRLELRATLLADFASLYDEDCIQLMRDWHAETGGELGIHFHPLAGAEFERRFHSRERAIYLHSRERKTAIIACFLNRFEEVFGFIPRAIGSYVLDAWTLRHIKSAYPAVKVATTNCFEEGVKMFQGNNHNWTLFSDGGPWWPFYPSKDSALCPARDEAEWLGIVALPHLNRDMIMALASRDDLFSSHPAGLFRTRLNEGDQCPYLFRFIDEWITQARWNGYSYYNVFVSSGWLTPQHWATDDHREAQRLYTASLEYLAQKRAEGTVRDLTMEEFADDFRRTVRPGQPQACLWNDVLTGGKRQIFWFVNAEYRAAVDLNIGGTVCDLRPFGGRLNRDLGPDTPALWNGNYPYLISAELRGGHEHTHLGCQVRIGTASAWISDRRTRAQVEQTDERWTLTTDPVVLNVGNHRVSLVTCMTFDRSGAIRTTRQVVDCQPPAPSITLRESFCATWGTIDYHEDMHGIVLSATTTDGNTTEMPFRYDSPAREVDRARLLSARVPQIGVSASLRVATGEAGGMRGSLRDGTLFHPYFDLSLEKEVAVGEAFNTELVLHRQTPA